MDKVYILTLQDCVAKPPTKLGRYEDTKDLFLRNEGDIPRGNDVYFVIYEEIGEDSYRPLVSQLELNYRKVKILENDYEFIVSYYNENRKLPKMKSYFIQWNSDGTEGGWLNIDWYK
jgi:hypothetical protein